MRFAQYLLVESFVDEIKNLVDDVTNQMAEEQYYNQDAILRVVRDRLSQDARFANDPARLESALEIASSFIE